MLDAGCSHMTIQMLLASSFLAGVIGGCASRTDATLDALVDYQLLGSEATQRTTMHIEPDGTVTRTNAPGPAETATLDPATLDDVARKIDDANFPTLEAMYGCGGCADDAVYTISVKIDRTAYTVQADSTANLPDRLRPVIDTLHDISELSLDWH